MDFLDPKKRFRHKVLLYSGYSLISVAIVIATTVLLYQAYGFGINKNGTVIQNGLVFFSSQPKPATISLNGRLRTNKTDTSIVLPAGTYQAKLQRQGYRSWNRTIEIAGGRVVHYDYPLLFPKILKTNNIDSYSSLPGLATQSPDRRWLMVELPGSMTNFEIYDLKNPTQKPISLNLPADIITKANGNESWQIQEWSDDNQHILLKHLYDAKIEYILLDRTDATAAVNLSQTLSGNSYTKLTLDNKKYDTYYLYNSADKSLSKASLQTPIAVRLLSDVLYYQTYGDNSLLYVTASGAPAGKVFVKETDNNQKYIIRTLKTDSQYLLDFTQYNGVLYTAIGASHENKVYIYKDPVGQLINLPHYLPVPTQVLHVNTPNYLSFAPNAQFIVTENGNLVSVYDVQNDHSYAYKINGSLDAPQVHVNWMDGDRLTYVSAGLLNVIDYDNTNQQVLMTANSSYTPFFAPDYSYIYTMIMVPTTASSNSKTPILADLTQTSLYIPADQP